MTVLELVYFPFPFLPLPPFSTPYYSPSFILLFLAPRLSFSSPFLSPQVVLDEVDTLLDDSFVGATTEVLSHVSLRGVHASRKIDQRDEFMKGISGGPDDGGTRTPLSTISSDSRHSSCSSATSSMSQSSSSLPYSSSPSISTVSSSSSSAEEAVVDLAQLVLVGATLPVGFQARLHRFVDTDSLHRVDTPHLHKLAPHVNHKFFRVQPSLKTGKSRAFEILICERIDSQSSPFRFSFTDARARTTNLALSTRVLISQNIS